MLYGHSFWLYIAHVYWYIYILSRQGFIYLIYIVGGA